MKRRSCIKSQPTHTDPIDTLDVAADLAEFFAGETIYAITARPTRETLS